MSSAFATRYVFTINNYTETDIDNVRSLVSSCNYLVFGREVGESGTPHLQGFLILKRSQRFTWLTGKLPRTHVEKARGNNDQAASYCKKDGDFEEFGSYPQGAGERRDLNEAIAWADVFATTNGRPPASPDIAVAQPTIYVRYPRFSRCLQFRSPVMNLQEGTMKPWQNELHDILVGPADDRKVLFYVDEDGGKGKTWFQRYYLTQHGNNVQVLGIGQRNDLAHSVKTDTKVFFFNVPRGSMCFLRYEVLEMLKDRMVFSPKYDSRTKIFPHNVHVVVFSNEFPDMTKMSADRYVLKDF